MAPTAVLQTSSVGCSHLQHSRPRSQAVSSFSSAFQRGCSLQTRQPSARQQQCRAVYAAAAGFGDEEENRGRRGRRRDRDEEADDRQAEENDGYEERVVQVRRVTKVVKGGKQLSFRAVVIVGDYKGNVGVGCASAKEVAQAVQRAVLIAKREKVFFPLNKAYSIPHRIDGYWGAAKVMLRPAADGAGVIAGGAVRVVLELAGVRNCFGKQLGSGNPLNNARAAIEGLRQLRTFKMVAQERGVSVSELMGLDSEPKTEPSSAVAGAMAGAV